MKKLLAIIVLFFLTQTLIISCNNETSSYADPLSGTTWEIKYEDGDIHQITFYILKDSDGNNCERKDLLDTNRLFVGGCKWTLYKNDFKIKTNIPGATPIRGKIISFFLFGKRMKGTYGKDKFTGKKIH